MQNRSECIVYKCEKHDTFSQFAEKSIKSKQVKQKFVFHLSSYELSISLIYSAILKTGILF